MRHIGRYLILLILSCIALTLLLSMVEQHFTLLLILLGIIILGAVGYSILRFYLSGNNRGRRRY